MATHGGVDESNRLFANCKSGIINGVEDRCHDRCGSRRSKDALKLSVDCNGIVRSGVDTLLVVGLKMIQCGSSPVGCDIRICTRARG